MITLEWKETQDGLVTMVPARDFRGLGHYTITAVKQPHYFDRGNYRVYVESHVVCELDDQEEMPRYVFDLAEITAWVNKRKECRNAICQTPS